MSRPQYDSQRLGAQVLICGNLVAVDADGQVLGHETGLDGLEHGSLQVLEGSVGAT